jgi:trehalose 6-phosphate phosphatase
MKCGPRTGLTSTSPGGGVGDFVANSRVNAVEMAVEAAADVLAFAPAALVTDVDGTLSRIVARPEYATVDERIKDSLRTLIERVSLVAVITGRSEEVARSMVGVPELVYVGNYALEGVAAQRLDEHDLQAAKETVRLLLSPFPCVEIEEKGVSFAMHYRNCADGAMRNRILSLVGPVAAVAGGRILEGKQVVEMVPRSLPNKDTAVAHLLEERKIVGTVYLGDDVSDVPVFEEIRRRRSQGLPGLAVAVVDPETHESVLETADIRLNGVDAVEAFLQGLVNTQAKGEDL